MSRDHRLFLNDMRASCEKITRYTRDLTREQFLAEERTFGVDIEILWDIIRHEIPALLKQLPEIMSREE